jgi:hypothetical protein
MIKDSVTFGYLVQSYEDTRQGEYRLYDDAGPAVWVFL